MADKYGIFIDATWCTACYSCAMACKVEHGYDHENPGVIVFSDGPRKLPNGKFEYTNLPVFTSLCDLCAERTAMGKLPTCVHHCQAACMKYGKVEDLAEMAKETPHSYIFVPEQ